LPFVVSQDVFEGIQIMDCALISSENIGTTAQLYNREDGG